MQYIVPKVGIVDGQQHSRNHLNLVPRILCKWLPTIHSTQYDTFTHSSARTVSSWVVRTPLSLFSDAHLALDAMLLLFGTHVSGGVGDCSKFARFESRDLGSRKTVPLQNIMSTLRENFVSQCEPEHWTSCLVLLANLSRSAVVWSPEVPTLNNL